MKTSAFVFLFLLLSSLSSAMDSSAKSAMPSVFDTFRTTESLCAGSGYADFLATETVRTTVPSPMRALRKLLEGQQRTSGSVRDICLGRNFLKVQGCCTKYVVSLLLRGGSGNRPLHDADYLRFGVLVI